MTGIHAIDIEEPPLANLDVFGVYAVIPLYRNSHKKNRLSMLGVIDTEHISRSNLPKQAQRLTAPHGIWLVVSPCRQCEAVVFIDSGYFSGKWKPASETAGQVFYEAVLRGDGANSPRPFKGEAVRG